MKDKSHLTEEGLKQKCEIKANMNTGRYYAGKLNKFICLFCLHFYFYIIFIYLFV